MKTLINKEMNLKLSTFEQISEEQGMVQTSFNKKVTYSELIKQMANTPDPQNGVGNIEEQMNRMEIIKLANKAKVNEKIELNDIQIMLLKRILIYYKFKFVNEDLIEFQKNIEKLIQ